LASVFLRLRREASSAVKTSTTLPKPEIAVRKELAVA
jgi:hypothetical protein